ncbi:hypothetical protein GCM10009638_15310 [Luteococcus sanguinis]
MVGMDKLTIDCGGCRNAGPACANCVVSALLGAPEMPELTHEEADAVAALAGQGLVPPLRLMPSRRGADTDSGCLWGQRLRA